MKVLKTLVVLPLLVICACRPSAEAPKKALEYPEEATEMFNRYAALQAKFDPALAELFADDAVIKHTRRYPDQTTREMTMPGKAYKEAIRKTVETAKARGDTNTYQGILSKVEDGKLRFTAVRYSDLKRNYTPISLLVAKRGDRWLIVEEHTHSEGVALDSRIPELKLLDGRVLKGVWVMSYGPDHISGRWQGGGGTIPAAQLPEEYRDALARALTPKEKK
ncbi:MAG TPA: hypothetical protein VEB66_16825 [Opitutaceae bacterium]|nr:hypothetical protein [Opitutaceae bacterium]